MAKAKVKNKNSARTAQSVETRIIEVSLQHPELGAVRLVSLLKKKRISVSAATVQNILRRHGLGNREARLAKLKSQSKKVHKPKLSTKKPATKISDDVAKHIVETSLQNPELGARRLVPLLKKKRISVSSTTIQNILRREGLQNRKSRLATVVAQSKKTLNPKRLPKKALPKITDAVAGRICKISLQNPDLGAKSLAPLLKEHGIFVSSSAVYSILKHHELHTRAKRYARAAEISSEPVIIPKTFSEKIPPEVEGRIVEISLQNHDCGARRLIPLLQQEEIFVSVSAVYRILKRHELENRQKRLSKLEALQAPETRHEPEIERSELIAEALQSEPTPAAHETPKPVFEPAVAPHVPTPPVDKATTKAEEQEPIAEAGETVPISFVDEAPGLTPERAVAEVAEAVEPAASAEPERPPAQKAHLNTFKIRSHPAFYPLYLLLFVLIGYTGFQSFQMIQSALLETGTVSAAGPAAGGMVAKIESAASEQPLNSYRRIWERNLFNIALKGDSETEKQIAVEKVALAKKDLGLKLVGTVMADNAGLRRAFIDNSRTRRQKAYREGEAAGKVRIKKILRNRVVVSTSEGDRLLVVDIEAGSETSSPLTYAQQISSASAGGQYPQQVAGRRRPGRSFALAREEVEDSLADADKLEQQLNIEPYVKDDQPAGFTIGKIPPESILRKMGLKSGNAIMGVNDEAITGPEQAAEFFQKLAEGGEMSIKARIGRGVRSRTRWFHLNIE